MPASTRSSTFTGSAGPGGGVAGDLRALERAAGRDRLLEAGDALGARALQPALVDQPLHHLVVVEARRCGRGLMRTSTFSPGASGFGSPVMSATGTTPGSELNT